MQADGANLLIFLIAVAGAEFALLHLWSEVAVELPMDWLEGGFLATISVVLAGGLIGVIFASMGRFSLVGIALLLLILSITLLVWLWPLKKLAFHRLTFAEIVVLLLLLVCAGVYFQPHEYVLGGSDAGTYVNIGATLARTGKFVLHEPWTEFLSAYSSVTLRKQPDEFLYRYLQFVGWYIDDHVPGRVVPQFFPFHPTLIAVGIQLAGVSGGLIVTPLWGVLGVVAVYLVARRLFDTQVASLSAVLLAITPTQIYFSRYPTTEPLTLLLVFTGLLAFQVLWDTEFQSRAWGVFGGLVFTAAFLTRIDLLVVFGCAVLFLGLAGVLGHRRPGWWACVISLGIGSVYATASAFLINWPYVWNTYGAVLRVLGQQPGLITLLIALAIIVGVGLLYARRRSINLIKEFQKLVDLFWLRLGLVLIVLLLSAYCYFLRPTFESTFTYPSWMSGDPIAVLDALNWVRIGWYVTPLGLFLATAGLAGILWRHLDLRWGFFLAVGILTTLQYVYKSFIPSYHIYMMRRYMPIVLPMLIVYAAFALVALFRLQKLGFKVVAVVLLISLSGGLVYQSRSVFLFRDHANMLAQLEALNEKLEPESLLVISASSESLFSDMIGAPFHFIFGHDVATVRQDNVSTETFARDLMEYASANHRPVQLLTMSSIPSSLHPVWSFNPVGIFSLTSRYLQHTTDSYPVEMQDVYFGIEIYDVSMRETITTSPDAVRIDIGDMDALYIGEGFYNKELAPDSSSMRWTTDRATVKFVVPHAAKFEVSIRAMIYRFEGVPPAAVEVLLDGNSIGNFVPTDSWQTFSFSTSVNGTSDLSELTLVSTTFNPAELHINADTRDLGILVDWIEVEALED